ncbi:nucleotidyl transferase AbiEii/AbiGii toxin family protein [Candidatus Poriferisodalis sp.]|uniref:nucleotidyl transferase AbiEii/AbiGii toxin family protein n=1 Tax=Candidatus Poriferisodalis sp. TaxID=3101277 RepID=UPI003B5C3515
MLTALQERICRLVGSLPDAESAALAGGGALIVHGIVDRGTTDLDFFSTDIADVRPTAQAVHTALEHEGLHVEVRRGGAILVRLEVTDGHDRTAVDFGPSRRAFPPVLAETGQVLTPEDLAGDKMAALFSRAAARDFVDVYALSARFSRSQLYELAKDKDTGFVLERLHDALGTFEHRYRQDFPVSDDDYERLRTWVHSWRADLPSPHQH